MPTPAVLKRRLLEARYLLADGFRRRFKRKRFDLERFRMLSDDGLLALQWDQNGSGDYGPVRDGSVYLTTIN